MTPEGWRLGRAEADVLAVDCASLRVRTCRHRDVCRPHTSPGKPHEARAHVRWHQEPDRPRRRSGPRRGGQECPRRGGQPIAAARARCISPAAYGSAFSTPAGPWRASADGADQPTTALAWRSLGALELTALPSACSRPLGEWIRETDAPWVRAASAVCVRLDPRIRSRDLRPSLRDSIWVGSATAAGCCPRGIGEDFAG